MFGSLNLGQNVSLGHDGENEWILTIGELSRLVRVLPGVVFLENISMFQNVVKVLLAKIFSVVECYYSWCR